MKNIKKFNYSSNYDNSSVFACDFHPPCDKDVILRTFMHYTDPDAERDVTVFGAARKDLFYNYSDRLYGSKWNEGLELAAKQATPKTARFFEIALNHFHDTDDVNLQHIMLGCNRSNGFSYLIFGYTYTEKAARQ